MISIDELRIILKLNGIDADKYTDEDLEHLIDYYTRLFDSLICFNYRQKEFKEFYPFNNDYFDSLLLNHYPVRNLMSVIVDNKNVYDKIKFFNRHSGIIYFKDRLEGDIHVHYRTGFTDKDIETLIIPIIIDLIIYGMKYGNSSGIISSLHEGDVSVTYDTSKTGVLSIQDRISDLNRRFCSKARML